MSEHDKPKVYWFKAKTYGYGWGLPCSWQGWLCFIIWLMVLMGAWFSLSMFGFEQIHALLLFVGITWVMCMVLLFVCIFKGEPVGWRWGKK
jgi:hypothetical protein